LLVGGALTDGGAAIDWFRSTFAVSTEEMVQLEVQVRNEIKQGTEGSVHALVFFSGERSTGFRDDATASLHGLMRSTQRGDILRALLEGVCLRLRAVIDLLQSCHPASCGPHAVLVASGAGLESSALWRWMLAQVTARKVVTLRTDGELTSRGVAEMLGAYNADSSFPQWDEQLVSSQEHPVEHLVQMYERIYTAHTELYKKMF
jgi:gluconokinase